MFGGIKMQSSVKEDRYRFVGGSDIAIIMGLSHFKTRWELLQEKAQIIEPEDVDNEYTRYGNTMEPKIRNYINELRKEDFEEYKQIKDDVRVHLDGFNSKKNTVLEVKTTSIIKDDVRDYKYYLVQLLFYMKNVGAKKGILAVYSRSEDFDEEFDPFKLQIFDINIKDFKDWVEEIELAVDQFRIDLEKVRNNPFITEEDLIPKEIVALSSELVEFENKLALANQWEKEYTKVKEQLRNAMNNNSIKTWVMNNGTRITNVLDSPDKEVEEDYYDEDRFMQEQPDLHRRYHETLAMYKETRKVLKKGRKGYLKITFAKESDE